jgi:hypothetical protein
MDLEKVKVHMGRLIRLWPIVLIAILHGYFFLLRPRNPYDLHDGLIPMISGAAEKPFVTRALLPFLARFFGMGWGNLHPILTSSHRDPDLISTLFLKLWGIRDGDIDGARAAILLEMTCYAFFGLALYLSATRILRRSTQESLLVAVVGMLVPFFWAYSEPSHIYDASTLAFAAWLTYLGLRSKAVPFAIVAFAALFAKESLVILYVVPILVANEAGRRSSSYALATAAVLEFFVSRTLLARWFGNNPGVTVELTMRGDPHNWHWVENLRVLLLLEGHSVLILLKLGLVLVPFCLAVRSAQRTVRLVAFVTSAVACLPLFFVGRFAETRVFFDVLPLWMLVAAPRLLGGTNLEIPPPDLKLAHQFQDASL